MNGTVFLRSRHDITPYMGKKHHKKTILLTAHRRESFNGGLYRIFSSIKNFAEQHADLFIFFPMHPNPNVIKAVKKSGINKLSNV